MIEIFSKRLFRWCRDKQTLRFTVCRIEVSYPFKKEEQNFQFSVLLV